MTTSMPPTAPTLQVERFLRYCRIVNSAMAVALRSNFVQTVSDRFRFGGPTGGTAGSIRLDLQSNIREGTEDCRLDSQWL